MLKMKKKVINKKREENRRGELRDSSHQGSMFMRNIVNILDIDEVKTKVLMQQC